jgi:sigma-B regulation protein RsbU (phosphoserine phosphatase)
MKIIIAEDDPVSRERLSNTLFVLGHEVQAFPNGLQAWRNFEGSSARMIISDWMMPEMDGIEFCRRIRQSQPK